MLPIHQPASAAAPSLRARVSHSGRGNASTAFSRGVRTPQVSVVPFCGATEPGSKVLGWTQVTPEVSTLRWNLTGKQRLESMSEAFKIDINCQAWMTMFIVNTWGNTRLKFIKSKRNWEIPRKARRDWPRDFSLVYLGIDLVEPLQRIRIISDHHHRTMGRKYMEIRIVQRKTSVSYILGQYLSTYPTKK